MNRKTLNYLAQHKACQALGLSDGEFETLRWASLRLHRWAELECNHDIQRDEATGKVTQTLHHNSGKTRSFTIPDRETPALKRCQAIVDKHGLIFYHQTDPRGAPVYIGRKSDLHGGEVDRCYSRLVAIYS